MNGNDIKGDYVMMKAILANDWARLLEAEFEKAYFVQLMNDLQQEYEEYTIYPSKENIFKAFELTSYKEVKVVILGQDPYHGANQAHGLSFSVQPGVKIPPSLKNIYKELQQDIGCSIPNHGCLIDWAEQGVLLLNTILTVREGEAHSHKKIGWERFTDEVIRILNARPEPIVFILWGKPAQSKLALIHNEHHKVITSPHPSPLSANRGFFGSKPFSRTNQYLREWGMEEINWGKGRVFETN